MTSPRDPYARTAIPLDLLELLHCTNRAQLRAAWLALTEDERRALRWNAVLHRHAWNLIIRDRVLTPGAAA